MEERVGDIRFEEIEKPIISKKIKIIGYSGNIWCADTFIPFLKSIKILNSIRNDFIKVKIFTFRASKISLQTLINI